jgi:DNA-binding MarR family transcriptional regulator
MDALERRGLAARVRSGADRRANALTLTSAGAELLARALRVQAGQEEAIRGLIGEKDRLALLAMLDRLATI